MNLSPHLRRRTGFLLLLAGTLLAACSPAYVVVPDRREGYSGRDTLYGRLKGKEIRVTFRHDTTWRVDTVTKWRTIYRNGTRVDTVVVLDTVRVGGGRRPFQRVDTVVVVVRDTVWRVDTVRTGILPRRPGQRVDTVRIVVHDTVRITEPRRPDGRTNPLPNTPGGPVILPRPPVYDKVDTVFIRVRDTVRVVVRDTVRIVVHDTVRVGGDGRAQPRTIQIPPGQFPPEGQCRLWIVGTPPGQQARAARCDALGTIPLGAFVLYKEKAWDMDYDWATDPDAAHVPPEILALRRGSAPPAGRTRTLPRPSSVPSRPS